MRDLQNAGRGPQHGGRGTSILLPLCQLERGKQVAKGVCALLSVKRLGSSFFLKRLQHCPGVARCLLSLCQQGRKKVSCGGNLRHLVSQETPTMSKRGSVFAVSCQCCCPSPSRDTKMRLRRKYALFCPSSSTDCLFFKERRLCPRAA